MMKILRWSQLIDPIKSFQKVKSLLDNRLRGCLKCIAASKLLTYISFETVDRSTATLRIFFFFKMLARVFANTVNLKTDTDKVLQVLLSG